MPQISLIRARFSGILSQVESLRQFSSHHDSSVSEAVSKDAANERVS